MERTLIKKRAESASGVKRPLYISVGALLFGLGALSLASFVASRTAPDPIYDGVREDLNLPGILSTVEEWEQVLGPAESETDATWGGEYLFYWPESGVAIYAHPLIEGQTRLAARDRRVTQICLAAAAPVGSGCGALLTKAADTRLLVGLTVTDLRRLYRKEFQFPDVQVLEFTNAPVPHFAKHIIMVDDTKTGEIREVRFRLNGLAGEMEVW